MKKRNMWFYCLCIIMVLLLTGCGKNTTDSNQIDNVTEENADSTPANVVRATYEAVKDNPTETEIQDTIYKMQKRVEELVPTTGVSIYQEGNNRIIVDIPNMSNPEETFEKLGKPGTLQFILYTDLKNKDGDTPSEGDEVVYDKEKVLMTGDMVDEVTAEAQQSNNTDDTQNIIDLKFNSEGAKKFAEITREYLDEQLAIVYDDRLISHPTVRSEITGGECIIEGSFTLEEAETLASTLRIGALPLEMKLIEVTNP